MGTHSCRHLEEEDIAFAFALDDAAEASCVACVAEEHLLFLLRHT